MDKRLFEAVCKGGIPEVKLLLDAGVDVGVRDNNGNTALDKAQLSGFDNVVELIESWGKDV